MLCGMQVAHFPTKGHHWRINLGLALNADMFVINKEEEGTTRKYYRCNTHGHYRIWGLEQLCRLHETVQVFTAL